MTLAPCHHVVKRHTILLKSLVITSTGKARTKGIFYTKNAAVQRASAVYFMDTLRKGRS